MRLSSCHITISEMRLILVNNHWQTFAYGLINQGIIWQCLCTIVNPISEASSQFCKKSCFDLYLLVMHFHVLHFIHDVFNNIHVYYCAALKNAFACTVMLVFTMTTPTGTQGMHFTLYLFGHYTTLK